ncbi:MAG: UDP-N-acetylmuramoyl-L-alanyl-D-glutamate--2,6-diaminopimelate ligase [Bacteroidetes bacterium]|nr:UDP-N-acetylmuramoyl-L-alanyl-D-glutamate--2,6-diaminopimelate ligase [Bacteroidota bacterium]MDA1084597.1 UDP-N-acetylmuramoyl-L-alanyl-D-glutamate--2,6-diaminopimelate ligase [Bacteroidota bacterium]
MKVLKDILFGVSLQSVSGSTHIQIRDITFDSRKVIKDALFVAVKGTTHDGHTHINDAIQNGATAILCEEIPSILQKDITYVSCINARRALATVAKHWYDNPSAELKLVGVTGTNGKTSVATMAYQLFYHMGYTTGLLSTVEIRIGEKVLPSTHTTPDALTTNKILRQMVDDGVTHCFMEVSSHGIDQDRIADIQFSGGVFTNLSHDHLDYHKDFKSYRDTKKIFFDTLPKDAFALSNADDKNGAFMLQNTIARKYFFGMRSIADFHVKVQENSFSGMLLKLQHDEVWTPLVGTFNAANFVSVYAIGVLLEMDKTELLPVLSTLKGAAGRFQAVATAPVTAIVDYAHTPDALSQVLETIDTLRTRNEKLITVVGCGGNRDKAKRPLMAKIAVEKSDLTIFTSDNPRNENPEEIISDMLKGVSMEVNHKHLTVVDRAQAIKTACTMSQDKDIVLVVGKGHETYQEQNGIRLPFDDAAELKQHLQTKK